MNEGNLLVGDELLHDHINSDNKNNEHLNICHLPGTVLSHLIQQPLLKVLESQFYR